MVVLCNFLMGKRRFQAKNPNADLAAVLTNVLGSIKNTNFWLTSCWVLTGSCSCHHWRGKIQVQIPFSGIFPFFVAFLQPDFLLKIVQTSPFSPQKINPLLRNGFLGDRGGFHRFHLGDNCSVLGFVTPFGEECLIWGLLLVFECVVHFGANSVILGEMSLTLRRVTFPEGSPVWDSILWGHITHFGEEILENTSRFGVSSHFGGESLISGRDQPLLGHHLVLRSVPHFWRPSLILG